MPRGWTSGSVSNRTRLPARPVEALELSINTLSLGKQRGSSPYPLSSFFAMQSLPIFQPIFRAKVEHNPMASSDFCAFLRMEKSIVAANSLMPSIFPIIKL